MRNRSSKSDDPNVSAFRAIQAATQQDDDEEPKEEPRKKNPHAVALGRRGGKKGGPARAEALSKERRKEIARKAAEARWRKEKEKAED